MDIDKIKQESRDYAFNHKGIVWRALWIVYIFGFGTSFFSSVIYLVNQSLSDGLSSFIDIVSLIITPTILVTFYTYITKQLNGIEVEYDEELEKHKNNWFNYTCTYFMVNLFVTLWSFLFIIPGIIKSLEYSQVMYIQSENPNMTWKECLKRSKQVMDGHKMELFKLELSFIGWFLLCVVTSGIALIWVVPYYQVTLVKYHQSLFNIDSNVIDVEEHISKMCPYCGSDISKDSNECSNCGSKIN